MVFLDGDMERRTVDLACGCYDNAAAGGIARGLEDVECATDVRVHIAVGSLVAVRYGYKCSQMEHNVGAAAECAAEVGVAYIAGDNLEHTGGLSALEPSP